MQYSSVTDPAWIYSITSEHFILAITGGSVIIQDKATKEIIRRFKGYTYLYTGGIRPDESDFFALENGKHFYVFSLKSFELVKRITLPRTYISIDMLGFYSPDGKILNIPAHRYIYDDKVGQDGHYEFVLCKYETDGYTLIEKEPVDDWQAYHWDTRIKIHL